MISPSILLPHSAMYSKYDAAAPTSPKAKDLILPCSSTTMLAMSSALSRILFAIFFKCSALSIAGNFSQDF